jgi:hypothetical protein
MKRFTHFTSLLLVALAMLVIQPAPPAHAAAVLSVIDLNTFATLSDPLNLSISTSYSVSITPTSPAKELEINLSASGANWTPAAWGYAGGTGVVCSWPSSDHYKCVSTASNLTFLSITAVPAAAAPGAISARTRTPSETVNRIYTAS